MAVVYTCGESLIGLSVIGQNLNKALEELKEEKEKPTEINLMDIALQTLGKAAKAINRHEISFALMHLENTMNLLKTHQHLSNSPWDPR